MNEAVHRIQLYTNVMTTPGEILCHHQEALYSVSTGEQCHDQRNAGTHTHSKIQNKTKGMIQHENVIHPRRDLFSVLNRPPITNTCDLLFHT